MAGIKDKVLVDYIWLKDAFKRSCAERQGFIVRTVWEQDYKTNGFAVVLKALK